MNIGFSLSPDFILGKTGKVEERTLLNYFGSPRSFIDELKNSGIKTIELRAIAAGDDPNKQLEVAQTIWEAGLELSVHGHLFYDTKCETFSQIYPSMSKILTIVSNYQENIVFTIHSFNSASMQSSNTEDLKNKTTDMLNHWLKLTENQSYTMQFSLELNRIKQTIDPSTSCEGVLNMVDTIPNPRLGICWDMGHYYYNYLYYKQDSSLPNMNFLSKVSHTHIHGLGVKRTHSPLTPKDSLPVDLYVKSLREVNYSGIYNLEFSFDRFLNIHEIKNDVFQSIDKLKNAY